MKTSNTLIQDFLSTSSATSIRQLNENYKSQFAETLNLKSLPPSFLIENILTALPSNPDLAKSLISHPSFPKAKSLKNLKPASLKHQATFLNKLNSLTSSHPSSSSELLSNQQILSNLHKKAFKSSTQHLDSYLNLTTNNLLSSPHPSKELLQTLITQFDNIQITPNPNLIAIANKEHIADPKDESYFNEFMATIDFIEKQGITPQSLQTIKNLRQHIQHYDNSGKIKETIYARAIESKLFNLAPAEIRKITALLISSKIDLQAFPETISQLANSSSTDESLEIIDQLYDPILDAIIDKLTNSKAQSAFKHLKDWQLQEVRGYLAAIITKTNISESLISALEEKNPTQAIFDALSEHTEDSPLKYNPTTNSISTHFGSGSEFDGLIWNKDGNLMPIMATNDKTATIEGTSLVRHPLSALAIQLACCEDKSISDEAVSLLSNTLDLDTSTLPELIKHLNQHPQHSIQIIDQLSNNTDLDDLIINQDPNAKTVISPELFSTLTDSTNGYFYGSVSINNPGAPAQLLPTNAATEVVATYFLAHSINQLKQYSQVWSNIRFPKGESLSELLTKSLYDNFDVKLSRSVRKHVDMDEVRNILKNPHQPLSQAVLSSPIATDTKSSLSDTNLSNIASSLSNTLKHYNGNTEKLSTALPGISMERLAINMIDKFPHHPEESFVSFYKETQLTTSYNTIDSLYSTGNPELINHLKSEFLPNFIDTYVGSPSLTNKEQLIVEKAQAMAEEIGISTTPQTPSIQNQTRAKIHNFTSD